MNKSELELLLKDDATPIYKLEQELGMPPTTLQKALTGGRNLPKKWALKLRAKFEPKEAVPEPSNDKVELPEKDTKGEKKKVGKKSGKKTPLPKEANPAEKNGTERLEGESSIEYRIRMAELQNKK